MRLTAKLIPAFLAALGSVLASPQGYSGSSRCRCFPGDTCWPSLETWSVFNQSIGGRLIATIPLGAPCHDPTYDETACTNIQSRWLEPEFRSESPSSIQAAFFANQSCDAFQPRARPCLSGNEIRYAVNVNEPADVSKTVAFAKDRNIRLVIRNTGHDYNGKSTGAGAIGLWMHNLKSIEMVDFKSRHYTGKAMKMGAGVVGAEVMEVAHKADAVALSPECSSVGVAGGYSQGGGHSPLSSNFGVAADQTLEWEVIDGRGNLIVANREKNADLYWALSGGGGSTYGVVYSLTWKVYPESFTTGANLTFTAANISQDTFFEAVKTYHATLPSLVDEGASSVGVVSNSSLFIALTGFGIRASQMTALLKPLTDKLTRLGITYANYIGEFPNFYTQRTTMARNCQVAVAQYGGWLVPRSLILRDNDALTAAYRKMTENGATVVGFGMRATPSPGADNAVLPAWRDNLIDTVIAVPWNFTSPWEDLLANQRRITQDFVPLLSRLASNAGAYMNEADPFQPNWQTVFYGVNYMRLRDIKAKYDPGNIFYAFGAVGSDEWTVRNDGRLCRA